MSSEAENNMEKCISYSLFGYNPENKQLDKNCFAFDSYIRNLFINIRINRLLYPNWVNVINLEEKSYNSPYLPVFNWLQSKGFAELNLCPDNQELCKAMLWRLKPIFFRGIGGGWRFSHIICRDADSVGTYREAQAVKQWIDEGKTIHCITDSISHNIPMMGGMIGIMQGSFSDRMSCGKWTELIERGGEIDFNVKGADQTFLNKYIYPNMADSATEHFILGMKQTIPEGPGRHYSIDPSIEINVPREYEEPLNAMAGHIGASGAYTTPLEKFLKTIDPYREDYREIEEQFHYLFYW